MKGTEKQIKHAEDIQTQTYRTIQQNGVKSAKTANEKKMVDEMLRATLALQDAHTWIEHGQVAMTRGIISGTIIAWGAIIARI